MPIQKIQLPPTAKKRGRKPKEKPVSVMAEADNGQKPDILDKTSVFENRIKAAVIEVQNLCNTHGIPFFMTFGVKTDENGKFITERVCSILPEMMDNQISADHRFADLINIESGGFKAVPDIPDIIESPTDSGFSNEDEDAIDMLTDGFLMPEKKP